MSNFPYRLRGVCILNKGTSAAASKQWGKLGELELTSMLLYLKNSTCAVMTITLKI